MGADPSDSMRDHMAGENLQRMWWLLLTSTCLSILLAVYNVAAVGEGRIHPWSAFDIGGSLIFLVLFLATRKGRISPRARWWLGPTYFAFWLILMFGYYATGLRILGETSTFILGAITPAVLILLPPRLLAGLLFAYFVAFCVLFFGARETEGSADVLGASFLNGSLGVLVAFLVGWFLYRARRLNFQNESAMREQAERARMGEERVRAILENLPFHAWLKSDNGRFLAVNRPYAAALGHTQEEILSMSDVEIFGPDVAREFRAQDGEVLRTGRQFHWERAVGPKGRERWHEVFKYPVFRANGEVAGIAGLSIDITDRKKLADSLQAADRAKSEFLAMMSHEIRTPMHSILGYARLLRDEVNGAKAPEYLQCVEENGELLLAIINDILDLSKIESGQLTLDPAPFAIGNLLGRIRRRFSSQAEQKGLQLTIELAPETPPQIVADERRLEQVLGNLVSNAIKFTSEGGVSVSVSPEVDATKQLALRCVVRDTGIGISEANLQRLFKPFSQLDNSIGRKFGGSGLGLVIARNLCVQMGGDIVVESREGSTFVATVQVERYDGELAPSMQEEVRDPSLNGLRVLVVEDNRTNRRLLETILAKWELDVSVAENGGQALETFRAKLFDVVLMDVQMPGMDGFETTRRIRAIEAGEPDRKRCRVIAVTAFAMIGDEQRCIAAGMDGYVGKPLNFAELKDALAGVRTK